MAAMRRFALVSLALSLAACGSSPSTTTTTTEGSTASGGEIGEAVSIERAPSRLPETVAPTRYTLTLSITPAQDRFSGEADIDVRVTERTSAIWIHGQSLDVTDAHAIVGGEAIAARWEQVDAEEGVARIVLERAIEPGEARLHFAWTAPFDQTLEGLYRVRVGEDAYAFTQFEALAARKAFPSFDEPRFKTPYDVTLVVPAGQGAFANSRELESSEENGVRRVRFAPTEPLPTYLVAWAVGPLDVVEATIPANAVRAQPLALRGLAVRGRGGDLAFAMQHTPRILAALEGYFGTPYPFDKLDIVAVPDFSAGAMENAGLVTFRDNLLLLSADAPIAQRRGFAFVMAHELAHQWFGNLVTMAWWDDLWLNEAFATWMETAIVREVFPEMRAEVGELTTAFEAFDADSLASARQIRNPIETSHDIHNAFDSITYSKGASVLAMFEHWLGRETFQRGVRRYLSEHARGNARGEDLMRALSEEAQRDVAAPLTTFLAQPGVPLIEARVECEGEPRLALTQRRYLPVGSSATAEATWQVPVCAKYRAGGQVRETCTLLTEAQGSMALEGGACPEWVHPNAGGTGYYRWTLPDDQLARLRTPQAQRALDTRDLLSIADSVRAGFASGRVSFESAARALEPFAESTDRHVATAPIELLQYAHDHLLETDAQRDAFRAYAARLYRNQLRRLGWGPRGRATEDGEVRLLRAAILSFLAITAKDPAVRRDAQTRGLAFVEGGTVHQDAVPSDLVSVALVVAAQEGGEELFARFEQIFAGSQDAMTRSQLLGAMASVDDAALRSRAIALTLDPRLRINEVFRPLMGQMSDRDGREPGWAWIQANYDAMAQRMGPAYAGYLPYATSGFCSAERANEVRSFFAPRMEATQGGPRNLESAVESISLCAARADAQRQSAQQFFSSAR
ncbi:Membrane alanine aminopeptidase N [Sandaracinus amylolyticus]|uniref:Aminopeptidase n=2 Tax=Sandaracinus amylolyticus TaxID=927083 RepID=A0A0F6WAK6_9BACT|nr:Membrane alanine aminopeptidase N [Sandaracinus amylolyticus]